jgi:hypothetical protein
MPSGQEYDQGNVLRLRTTFYDDVTGVLDPTVVNFEMKPPGATTPTLYTYPTNPELVKDSTGNYHVDVDLDTPGWWVYRWFSTGSGKAATPGWFSVRADPVS